MFLNLLGVLVFTVGVRTSGVDIGVGNFEGIFDFDLYERVLDSELCARQLQQMNAFEFYDASFRVPQGLLTGNMVNFGNYFQCLGIRQEVGDEHAIEGKHCMISFSEDAIDLPSLPDFSWPELPTSLADKLHKYKLIKRGVNLLTGTEDISSSLDVAVALLPNLELGVCIPKSCTVDEALGRVLNTSLVTVNYQEQHCRLPDDKPFVAADYVAIIIFSAIGLITILSTAYELRQVLYLKKSPKEISTLYSCCSVYSNTRRLFTFSSRRSDALDCLDGIRTLSILWVIIGHTLLTMLLSNISNLVEALDWFYSVKSLWLTSANIAVDTFLMLSGLLLIYTSTPKLSQMGLVKNIHLFYLNRLLRMFPILATAVLLQASVFHRVDDGVNWYLEGQYVQYCRKTWWATFLYIQNYFNPQQECLPHTWYLAVDMQLHILSPLVLIWVLGGRRSAWAALAIGLSAALIASTTFNYINNFSGSSVGDQNGNYFNGYYVNTLTRAPVFIIGMVYGYIFHVNRGQKMRLPKWFVLLCWACSLILLGSVIFAYHPNNKSDFHNQQFYNFVNSFNRPLWVTALGWVIFACVNGYGGPVNWFLSLTVWKFIARISYAMYIFHYPMQFITASAITTNVYFSLKNIFLNFLIDLSTSVMLSVVVCILIDTPFSTLQGLLLGGKQKSPPRPLAEEPKLEEKA